MKAIMIFLPLFAIAQSSTSAIEYTLESGNPSICADHLEVIKDSGQTIITRKMYDDGEGIYDGEITEISEKIKLNFGYISPRGIKTTFTSESINEITPEGQKCVYTEYEDLSTSGYN